MMGREMELPPRNLGMNHVRIARQENGGIGSASNTATHV